MTGTLTDSQQVERQTLIRRSLLGLDYWLYRKAFLLPFCDYLKIFLNKPDPTVITLWESANTRRPIFSTHPHVETKFCEEGGVLIPHSKRVVACYRSIGASFLSDENARLAFVQLFAHPDFNSPHEGKQFGQSLKMATEAVGASKNRTACKTAYENAVEQTDWDTTCEAVFSNVWKILEDSPHFRLRGRGNLHTTNLFPFLFVAKGKMGIGAAGATHQAQCVLSKTQRSFLGGSATQTSDLIEQFCHIFGREAAMAFQTGTVTLADPLKDQDLSAATECPGFKALALMHRVYVPIHVEGVAWIVLLRFFKDSDIPGFYDIFHFYSDVIPRIGAMLRTEAKALYLNFIERLFSDEIAKSDLQSIMSRFNKGSMNLLPNLPFPHVYLTDKDTRGNGEPLNLPDGRRVFIGTEPNPYFNPEWTYDPLGGLETKEACERAKAAFANEERRIRARFLGHRHSIVNLKPGPLLHAALIQDETQISGKARDFVADAEKTSEVLFATLDFVMSKMHQPLQGKRIAGILAWLKEHETSGVGHASLEIDSVADFLPPQDAMEDVFLVFWNLWHNASQRGDFAVHVGQHDGLHRVVFFQKSEWPKHKRQWVDFLNGVASSPNTEPEKRGLEIVEQSLRHLRWNISVVAAPAVKITIEIPQNRQS